jgi:hypothetical protein
MTTPSSTESSLRIGDSGRGSVILGGVLTTIGFLIPIISVNPSLTLLDDLPWWALGIIGPLILISAGVAIFTAEAKWLILRKSGSSELIRKKIIGGKTTSIPFSITDIISTSITSEVSDTATSYEADSTSTTITTSILWLHLRNGTKLEVKKVTSEGSAVYLEKLKHLFGGTTPLEDNKESIDAFIRSSVVNPIAPPPASVLPTQPPTTTL